MPEVASLACALEVKFAGVSDAPAGTFSGYGAVFGNVDSYGDVIAKGAFKDTLRDARKSGAWPTMLSQHGGWGVSADDMMPIGIWTELREDDTGLYVEGKLALETQRGKDAYALLKMEPRPALNGLSIGYMAKEFTVGTKPKEPRRTLKRVDLLEVSLVTFPANAKARIGAIKAAADITSAREFEEFLRQAGFAKGFAAKLTAGGWKAVAGVHPHSDDFAALVAELKRRTDELNRIVKV